MEERGVLIISFIIFIALLVAALFVNNIALASDLAFISIMALLLPFSMVKFIRYRKFKAYEKVFPVFLRDLAESIYAGTTLSQSVQIAAKNDYGSFTQEVERVANQLSWNIPLEKVMDSFAVKMRPSKIIVRSISIIKQAEKSGGDVAEAMGSLAENISSLRDVQEEKSVLLNQQMFIIYAIFFIFLGISLAILRFLIPLFETQTNVGGFIVQGFNENPCQICFEGSSDPGCFGCFTMATISSAFGFGSPDQTASYYRALFFSMIMIQGFFSGLIAGQITSDSIVAGIKHSLVMLVFGAFVFILTIKLGVV